MARKILSVSFLDDKFQFLEIEKQAAGFFPHPKIPVSTSEALNEACRKADEIYVNDAFPTAIYDWDNFPKVARKYLYDLVGQDAHEKQHIPERLWCEFKEVGDVMEAGVSKRRLAYMAIREEEALAIWGHFKGFQKKVRHIAPVPSALGSAISLHDSPAANFFVVWIGPTSSLIAICSPDGLVKVARSVPVFLAPGEMPDDPEMLAEISRAIDQELTRTSTFFKQEFREPDPDTIYLLGHTGLEGLFENHPLSVTDYDIRFRLASQPVQNMSDQQISENLHLIGNLFLPKEFNFVPHKERVKRKISKFFNMGYAAMALLAVLALIWGAQLRAESAQKLLEYQKQRASLQTLQSDISAIRQDINRLKPLEGWKKFYEQTYANQPRWNLILSELALTIPPHVLIENFQILPVARGNGSNWRALVSGQVEAPTWQRGLELLRQYGAVVESSPLFSVENVRYAPENLEADPRSFSFELTLQLKAEGAGHES